MDALKLINEEERKRLIKSILGDEPSQLICFQSSEEDVKKLDSIVVVLKSIFETTNVDDKHLIHDEVDQVSTSICLPLLKHIVSMDRTLLLTKTKDLIDLCVLCFLRSSDEIRSQMISIVIDALSAYLAERGLTSFKEESSVAEGVFLLVDFTFKLYSNEEGKKLLEESDTTKLIVEELLKAMLLAEDKVAGQILGTLFQVLPMGTKEKKNSILNDLWAVITTTYEKHGQKLFYTKEISEMSERPFLILCGMADLFFPVTGMEGFSLELINSPDFWNLLMSGFFHSNALTRKRTLYLFKRILDIIETHQLSVKATESEVCDPLFWWAKESSKELSVVWTDFFLLIETLEEKQVHVIRPVMPRFKSLTTATFARKNGYPLLHTSWLTTIIQRIAGHESSHINRMGVVETLNIDFVSCPILRQTGTNFLCGPFVKMLAPSSVYYKPPDTVLGSCPPVAKAMIEFFNSICGLDRSISKLFYHNFFEAINKEFWSGSALTYILYGMAQTRANDILDAKIIQRIRDTMHNCMSTLEVHFRGATACFMVQTIMNLSNPELFGPDVFMQVLAMLRRGESYLRGSSMWKYIADWFVRMADNKPNWGPVEMKQIIIDYTTKWLSPPKTNTKIDHVNYDGCTGLARMLFLVEDAGLLQDRDAENKDTFQDIVTSITGVISVYNAHAYASHAKALRALCLLVNLLKESETFKGANFSDRGGPMLSKILSGNRVDLLLFLHRRLECIETLDDAEHVGLYLEALLLIIRINPVESCSLPVFESMVQSSIDRLSNSPSCRNTTADQMSLYTSMVLLGAFSDFLSCISEKEREKISAERWVATLSRFLVNYIPRNTLAKPVDLTAEENLSEATPSWGKITSEFLVSQWTCFKMLHHLNKSPFVSTNEQALCDYVESCLACLDLVGSESLVSIFSCLKQLIPLTSMQEDRVVYILQTCMKKVFEDPRSKYFWKSFKSCVHMTFMPFLLSASPKSELHKYLLSFGTDLFELGEEKQGYVNILVHHLLEWISSSDQSIREAVKFSPLLVKALLFGPIHSRGRRFTLETMEFVYQLGDQVTVNQMRRGKRQPDSQVRVMILNFLSTLRVENKDHSILAWKIIEHLFDEQKELVKYMSHRNFSNSLSHRQKHRIFCSLLVLDSFVDQDHVAQMFGFLMTMLEIENQSTVRIYIEWLVIRLVHRFHPLRNDLWYLIAQGSEKKAAFLCSLLSIVSHLCKLLNDKTEQELVLMEALPRILPWSMAHHFNVRVYAQAAMVTLWNLARLHKLRNVLHKHSIIESFMEFSETNKYYSKNTERLLDNFFFHFHPLKHFSIETITQTLPYLTLITDEEWIEPELFRLSAISRQNSQIPLHNSTDDLKECNPGTWRVRVELPDTEENVTDGDVQKKMIPWRSMLPQNELELGFHDGFYQKKQAVCAGGLVLVTSLIDKIPNLGGLCRTSEIFGVSEYVIGNLKYTTDKAFESLSVTAQKWLPIKEVNPRYLKEYLLEMKEQGYTLAGAEQTANSKCLTEYTFPRKTVLVLGNEREGIPVNLIQLLDVCVEIPQQGIIRSLNVHVSGALLIWEYTRQQMSSLYTDLH